GPPRAAGGKAEGSPMTTMNRRTFTTTVLAGVGAAVLPSASWAAKPRNLEIGYTTLIWGALPRAPQNLEPALTDISALGFHGFETFASILDDWETKGTLGRLL